MKRRLPILIMLQRKTAMTKGFRPIVFKVWIDKVEPIRNKVRFNPDLANSVIPELSRLKKGK